MNTLFQEHLEHSAKLHVRQVMEGFEIVLGWETRNKYRILDENEQPLAYAAEQSQGMGGALMRQVFGHWRKFDIIVFNEQKEKILKLHFPFRWFFKTLIVSDSEGRRIGHLQQRFAFFRKKFDVYDVRGRRIANINSGLFKLWTFEFFHRGRKLGGVYKKWGSVLTEFFTDKDNYVVSFADPTLDPDKKALMLSMCLLIDIVYFENNQSKVNLMDLVD